MADKGSDNQGVFYGQIDPEIANLMGIDEAEANKPDFNDLFEEPKKGGDQQREPEQADLTKTAFPTITKYEEDPKPYFQNKEYYKVAVSSEGESSKRVHDLLSRFIKAEDPQDRSLYRGRLVPAFWDLAGSAASKIYSSLPEPKVLMLRFGLLSPTLVSPGQRTMISKIIFENTTGEPIHYVDEWLKKVASGEISASATDETKAVKRNEGQVVSSRLDKARGQVEAQSGMIAGKMNEIEGLEYNLSQLISTITSRQRHPVYSNLKNPYSPEQKNALSTIGEILRKLSVADKEVNGMFRALDNAASQMQELKVKAEEMGESVGVDDEAIGKEFNTVRQMAKMCIGRQGNHFPILMKQYFRESLRDIATRENVIRELATIEALDGSLFERTFKRQTNRIVPYVILVPCYGDKGICWEPFERFNKATSRGRVAIPMFPKDLRIAVLSAVADLRWQVAKERAQHYWMEEGLTGKYYQYFTDNKRKGDVKEAFVQDYILWITKESEGTQKLEREARGVFWRNIPFPQAIKDNLKNRGFVYNELYKKDVNISKSDGY